MERGPLTRNGLSKSRRVRCRGGELCGEIGGALNGELGGEIGREIVGD